MADFTGFYFDNIHSSNFGILRVSDGDRYKYGLCPEFEDSDTELPKGGSIYHGRTFKKTEFEVSIAFDHLTETQLRKFQQWLSGEEVKAFRFDERPYKTYWAKLSKRPELEYICFMEHSDNYAGQEKIRIYKGEGTLSFVCYDPMGYCVDETYDFINGEKVDNENGLNRQDLKSYLGTELKVLNVEDWAGASGLKRNMDEHKTFIKKEDEGDNIYEVPLYNPGDRETDFQLLLTGFSNQNADIFIKLLTPKRDVISSMSISPMKLSSVKSILIDTKKHAIIVYNSKGKELRYDILNKDSSWIKIPLEESILQVKSTTLSEVPSIKYNYIYY